VAVAACASELLGDPGLVQGCPLLGLHGGESQPLLGVSAPGSVTPACVAAAVRSRSRAVCICTNICPSCLTVPELVGVASRDLRQML
jgi:hypothetical protein